MKIKNLTAKPIGFGSTVILPDTVDTLPQGYGSDHPTVKYYLSRKWIKEVGGGSDSKNTAAVNVGLNINTGADGENNGGSTGDDAGSNVGNGSQKTIDRMNKEELQSLAFERGVAFADTDTKAMLIEKIKAAQTGNE